MKQAGQIVLFKFPKVDLEEGKLRPALLISKLPGEYDDWLICMVSSQIHHCIFGFDEIVQETDPDFVGSGLKTSSVIRIGRLAVIEGELLLGATGKISTERFQHIKIHLVDWIIK